MRLESLKNNNKILYYNTTPTPGTGAS